MQLVKDTWKKKSKLTISATKSFPLDPSCILVQDISAVEGALIPALSLKHSRAQGSGGAGAHLVSLPLRSAEQCLLECAV